MARSWDTRLVQGCWKLPVRGLTPLAHQLWGWISGPTSVDHRCLGFLHDAGVAILNRGNDLCYIH